MGCYIRACYSPNVWLWALATTSCVHAVLPAVTTIAVIGLVLHNASTSLGVSKALSGSGSIGALAAISILWHLGQQWLISSTFARLFDRVTGDRPLALGFSVWAYYGLLWLAAR
jgi:hypothetical protein